MKPNFALNLTHEAIGLLHRTARGWLTIGEAALDSADLGEALGYLRASALGLAPQGMTTKLVIPNSQILYTEVEAPSPDPERRLAQVRAALDGLTPYAVDELVFDVHGTGPRVQVAVVARETLVEAESFAVQHRMNPLSCVAIPPEGAFGGEPFFGPTEHAAKVLAPGDSVERDAEPVSIVTREDGAARAGTAEGQTRAARRQRAAAAAAAAEARAAAATPLVAPEEPAAPAPLILQDTPPEPAAAEAVPVVPEPAEPAPMDPAPTMAEAPAEVAPPSAPTVEEWVAALPEVTAPPAPAPPVAAEPAVELEAVAEAPLLIIDDPEPEPEPTSPVAAFSPAEPAVASPQVPRAMDEDVPVAPAFSSRRRDAKGSPAAATLEEPEGDLLTPPPLTRTPPPLAASATPAPAAPSTPAAPVAAPPVAASADPEAKPAARREAPPLTVVASVPGLAGIKAAAGGTSTVRGLPPAVEGTPPLRSVPRPTLVAAPSPAPVTPPATKPPARGRAPSKTPVARGAAAAPAPRGKPRFLGLILTGLLLLVLVAVAAWSSLYLSSTGGETQPETQVATATDPSLPEAPAPVELTTDALPGAPANDVAAAPGAEDPEYLADLAAMGVAPEDAVPDPNALQPDAEDLGPAAALPPSAEDPAAVASDPVAETPAAEAAAPPEAPAEVASDPVGTAPAEVTSPPEAAPAPVAEAPVPVPVPAPETATAGLASAAPLTAEPARQDEIFLSASDSPPPAFDPAALPPPGSRAETPPAEALPPPPAGTLYKFDEQGRILASESGVVMPGGFWMIEARPPVLPPERPASLATAPEAAAEAAPAATPETTPEAPAEPATEQAATVEVDPTIAAARPRGRPASLVAPAAPEAPADDGAALFAPVGLDFAAARPRGRPAALVAAAAPDAPADDSAAVFAPVELDVAAFRPRARAGSTVALANTARLDTGSASLVQTASAAAAPPPSDPEAVMAFSPRPAPRPAALSSAVEAAVAEAALPFDPEPAVAAPPAEETVAALPEAEAEPEAEVATAAPRIPTRASVAKQATLSNAMNLSKVNLIGIFGSPSDRHAMVRTSQGRMVKVKVGDRIDGGTVAAITASELRYQKGGKLLTLAMPRG